MRNRIRGKVFIINNKTFEKKAKLSVREGSDVDAKNLESLFTQLQFEVVIAKNQTGQVYIYIYIFFMVFNTTFNNISVISWRSVLL